MSEIKGPPLLVSRTLDSENGRTWELPTAQVAHSSRMQVHSPWDVLSVHKGLDSGRNQPL